MGKDLTRLKAIAFLEALGLMDPESQIDAVVTWFETVQDQDRELDEAARIIDDKHSTILELRERLEGVKQ